MTRNLTRNLSPTLTGTLTQRIRCGMRLLATAAAGYVRSWRQSPLASEWGGSLVEVAVLIPVVLVPLLLASGELAYVNYMAIEVSSAARAGVQYGAQSASMASSTSGIQAAAQSDGVDVNSIAGLTVTSSTFYQCYVSATGTAIAATSTTTCALGHLIEFVQVNTQATVTPLIRYPGSPSSYTLSGQAIMRVAP